MTAKYISTAIEWTAANLSSFDAVVISTKHAAVNYQELAAWSKCIIDTRNAMRGIPTRPNQLWSA